MLQAEEQTRKGFVTEKLSCVHCRWESLLSLGLPAPWRFLLGFLEIPGSDTAP